MAEYRNSLRSKRLIRQAFAELMQEKQSIDKITVKEIIERADISKSTFYSHYQDIYALLEDELWVCDIANIVGTTQSAISHRLRILKQAKLVKFRKEGKVVFYSLDDNHIHEIVKKGCEHIEEL